MIHGNSSASYIQAPQNKEDRPYFSVVIPVYNKGKYVARALQSVLKQTFENFELLIICEPSIDKSHAEVAAFADSRLKIYYRSQPGPGGYAARNLGIKKSKGKWVSFLDADDEWYPHHLEKMYALSKSYPEAYFMSCGWDFVESGIKERNKFHQKHTTVNTELTAIDYFKNCMEGSFPVHTNVACIKNESQIISNLFPAETQAKRGGDLYAWLKLICFHKKLAWSNHVGAKYFLGVEGQVVSSAPRGVELFKESSLKPLEKNLNSLEKKMLYQYIHRLLFRLILYEKLKNHQITGIKSVLNYRNDFLGAIKTFLICTVIPSKLLKLIRHIYKKL